MVKLGNVSCTGQLTNFCWTSELLQNKIKRLVGKTIGWAAGSLLPVYSLVPVLVSFFHSRISYEFSSLFHYL